MSNTYRIIADLHTHTLASTHAYSSVTEMIRAAAEKGLYAIALTDHARTMPGSPREWYFSSLHELPLHYRGVMNLAGIEANVLDFEGHLDIEPRDIPRMDWVVASIHNHSVQVRKQNIPNCKAIALCCKKHGVPIVVDSDAHFETAVGEFSQALEMLSEIDFPEELILNASARRLDDYLAKYTGIFERRIY